MGSSFVDASYRRLGGWWLWHDRAWCGYAAAGKVVCPAGGRVGTACRPGRIGTVTGRFVFYRRRRVLPFVAAWCLVFVNGATLAPLAVPLELLDGLETSSAAAAAPVSADTRQRPRYEQGSGEQSTPALAANVPPPVKNLRRPAPTRTAKAVVRGWNPHVADVAGPRSYDLQRLPAANAADLTRLCRLLL